MAATAAPVYQPHGSAIELLYARETEVVVSGSAGTGKSTAALMKLHLCAGKYAGSRLLIVRKTRESITQSAMVTLEHNVFPPSWEGTIRFNHESQEYRYPNGSTIGLRGMDRPSKVLSSEYDLIYVQEAIELTEDEWEQLTTRLRHGVMPYQQQIADTNPDAPTHWIMQRANRGQLRLIESRHEDNPSVTQEYLAKLDALTGVRYKRFRLGLWVAAEGQVYEEWDPAIHLIDHKTIPDDWPRYIAIDFGYTDPFVAQWWAKDPDGRLIMYREIYETHRLVEDLGRELRRLSMLDFPPVPCSLCAGSGVRFSKPCDRCKGEGSVWRNGIRECICDHDAEGRATLEKYFMATRPAYKAISDGIQAVQARLKLAGDGRPRLYAMRDSLVHRDTDLTERKLPCGLQEEIGGYIWDTGSGRKKGELPVDKENHAMDAMRYVVSTLDRRSRPRFEIV